MTSTAVAVSGARPGLTNSGLRSECLSFTEVLGQSVAHISPTLTPTVVVPLVFASSGNGTWFVYLLATVALALVGLNINQFARGSASSGALYAFIGQGLGPVYGIFAGWALVYASVTTAVSVLAGSLNYVQVLLQQAHINSSALIPCIIGVGIAWWIAYKDVKLSAKIMLTLELISVVLILIVSVIVLIKNGFRLDMSQFGFKGVSPDGIRLGLMLGFFSYVGFESATTLGDEAKEPLKNIPRAVLMSVIIAGLFFMFSSYTQVLGFHGAAITLDKSNAPYNVISARAGVGFLAPLISLGAIISMWACTLAAINAASRIFFAMARHGLFPSTMGSAHGNNLTPHLTVHICSFITLIITGVMIMKKVALTDICGFLGTLSSFGFLVAYILICIGAPIALARIKKLRAWNVICSLIAIVICGAALVSNIYPVPPAPGNIFPYIFLGYMLLGGIWLLVVRKRYPNIVREIAQDLNLVEEVSRNKGSVLAESNI